MNLALALKFLIQGILLGGIYGLTAVGLSLIFGVMGVINFAHGQMTVMGMYISYWILVLLGLDPYLSLPLAAGAIFLLGFMIQSTVINRILDFPEAMQMVAPGGSGPHPEKPSPALLEAGPTQPLHGTEPGHPCPGGRPRWTSRGW